MCAKLLYFSTRTLVFFNSTSPCTDSLTKLLKQRELKNRKWSLVLRSKWTKWTRYSLVFKMISLFYSYNTFGCFRIVENCRAWKIVRSTESKRVWKPFQTLRLYESYQLTPISYTYVKGRPPLAPNTADQVGMWIVVCSKYLQNSHNWSGQGRRGAPLPPPGHDAPDSGIKCSNSGDDCSFFSYNQ